MDDERLRRVALNEAVCRETNETIARRHEPGTPAKEIRFRCECAHVDCIEALQLSLGHYAWVRRTPRRFILLEDHVIPEAETVVFKTYSYVVVEKKGVAGDVAEDTAPQS